MAEPIIKTHWQTQECKFDVPASLFAVSFGYKGRDRIQLRLKEDGCVYLGDARESRRFDEPKHLAATVSFDLFSTEWPRFVEYLRAKAAEDCLPARG